MSEASDSEKVIKKLKSLGGSMVYRLVSIGAEALVVIIQNQIRIEERLNHIERFQRNER